MNRKLPDDAFAFYCALGSERSYDAVAKHYGTAKKTIVRAAEREQWQSRLEAIERKAREATDARLADDMHEMSLRHRKLLMAMASRAATAIQSFPLENGMQGIKAAELVIKLERLVAGEPTEARTISVETVTRDEMSRFLIEDSALEEWDDDPTPDASSAELDAADGLDREDAVDGDEVEQA